MVANISLAMVNSESFICSHLEYFAAEIAHLLNFLDFKLREVIVVVDFALDLKELLFLRAIFSSTLIESLVGRDWGVVLFYLNSRIHSEILNSIHLLCPKLSFDFLFRSDVYHLTFSFYIFY